MKAGNLVKFFDYKYSAAHGGARQRWAVGIVIGFWTPSKEEVIEYNLSSRDKLAIIAHNGTTQWITIPSRPAHWGPTGWVEILA